MSSRFSMLSARLVETFAVYQPDGYTKVPGLAPSSFQVTTRFDGVKLSPGLTLTIDEPSGDGEYRIVVPAGQLAQLGFYQVEVAIPAYTQRWQTDVQVINNIVDLVRSMFVGSQVCNLQVRTSASAPIGDAIVQVFDSTGQTLVQAGKTNTSTGDFSTALDPGTYTVIVSKPLTAFVNPFTVTVPAGASAPVNIPLLGTPQVVQPPASPQLCRISGYLQNMDGSYRNNYVVGVACIGEGANSYIKGPGAISATPQGVARDKRTVSPDPATGIWYVDLVQGIKVSITIDAQKIARTFVVPALANVNFRDIAAFPQSFNAGSVVPAPNYS